MGKRIRLLILSVMLAAALLLTGAAGCAEMIGAAPATYAAQNADSRGNRTVANLSLKKKKKNKKKNKKNNSNNNNGSGNNSGGDSAADTAADSRVSAPDSQAASAESADTLTVEENGSYTSKEEVALYIHTYGKLPDNYISKREAEDLGWNASRGNLWDVAPGKSIGGSRFGNYEGLLPESRNRKYYECDIDFDGGYRNAKRIIYSNDGLVFYTEDHYKTFEQLY